MHTLAGQVPAPLIEALDPTARISPTPAISGDAAAVSPSMPRVQTSTLIGAASAPKRGEEAAITAKTEEPATAADESTSPIAADDLSIAGKLKRRAKRLATRDPVGAARAWVELGLYEERVSRDRSAARKAFEAARELTGTLGPALSRLRRLLERAADGAYELEILDDEILAADNDDLAADLLAERARLCSALGRSDEVERSYARALELSPKHAASLRGLEAALRTARTARNDTATASELASHLERLATAYAPRAQDRSDGDARLAAWIHVERAAILDADLDLADRARSALEHAVAFEPGPGPVRDALHRHLIRRGDVALYAASLSVEADHEPDGDRAARLLYASARISVDRAVGEEEARSSAAAATEAIPLLRRAEARTARGTPTERRIMGELVRLLEVSGDAERAAEAREKRLSLLEARPKGPANEAVEIARAIAHEHLRLSEIYDTLGRADRAVQHAERALAHDRSDTAARDRLDRALLRLGRHEERIRALVAEANEPRPTRERVAALLRASDAAANHLRRRDEAIAHLRAAWAIDPGNQRVFDALSALLVPPPRDADEMAKANARARIDLYTQAAEIEKDPVRRVGLLEKLAAIWEDELGKPARAIEVIEKILAIEPDRRSAILALERCAERAGDMPRLAAALAQEAEQTEDVGLSLRLLLRAAEVLGERAGDRDRGFALLDRATAIDAKNPEVLRVRQKLLERAGRHEEARRAILARIAAEQDESVRYALWIEVAVIDEHRRKSPSDAVEAYAQAAILRPGHPLPAREITRLYRELAAPAKLAEALLRIAASAKSATEYTELMLHAAEVQELMLRDDKAALACLAQVDALADVPPDPAIAEAMERILARSGSAEERVAHYSRRLERKPPAAIDHALRVALAGVLCEAAPAQAAALLEGLLSVVPAHVPALRMLEQIHREGGAFAPLAAVLRAEAEIFAGSLARAGALWELAALEDHIGAAAALDALVRLIDLTPRDAAAIDAFLRTATKLIAAGAALPPAALATRARIAPALRSRRDLVRDPIARAIYEIEEAMLIETGSEAADPSALKAYRAALKAWPESLLAADGLARLAERAGDRPSLVEALSALAKLSDQPIERSRLLVRAASLVLESGDPSAHEQALVRYEEALAADPSSSAAAQALVRLLATDAARLIDRLGAALERTTSHEQIVLLGVEIGRAILRRTGAPGAPALLLGGAAAPQEPIDPGVGVAAMRRVNAILPDDVSSLILFARLLVVQRVWAEAGEVLLHAVEVARDAEPKITAYFMLVDLYEGPLSDLDRAEAMLDAILAIDEKNRRALERLHGVATASGALTRAVRALARLADITLDPAARVDIDLRLADTCRDAGDAVGRARALCDAIAAAPSDARPWSALARLYRVETKEGAASYAAALQQVLDIAAARRLPLDQRWLTTLGTLEVTTLMRPRDGIAHLKQAVLLPGAPPEARAALGRGLEAAGRNAEAVQVLRELLSADGDVLARLDGVISALSALDAALSKEGRVDERAAVEEVRACLGDVKPDRLARLRARRATEGSPYALSLASAELTARLLPDARSPMLDVAAAIAPIAAKILRFELSALGVTSRERLGQRDGHPTRVLADRIARALGVEAFEVYLTPGWQGAARVYPGDPPVLVGSTAFADLPEPEQLFALARLLVRVALGLTWLDELAVEAMDGMLLASLRIVEPEFGQGELTPPREAAAQSFRIAVDKAIGRRQKKLLEEIVPHVPVAFDARAFSIGARRSEYRLAYAIAGDLVGAIDYLRRFDRDIARSLEEPRVLLQHPVTNELIRWAITAECFAERRRIGTVLPPA